MEFQEMYKPRERVVKDCTRGGRTKASFRDECDINVLMRRYLQQGGQLPPAVRVGTYGDFSGPTELMDAYELVKRAELQFASLPSGVRERFKNQPAAFLAFVQDKSNQAEAKKLGLLEEELPLTRTEAELKRIADTVADRLVAPAKPPAP